MARWPSWLWRRKTPHCLTYVVLITDLIPEVKVFLHPGLERGVGSSPTLVNFIFLSWNKLF